LSGFHFYGTDLCLNAVREGRTAYIVGFPVTHLSSGNFDNPEFVRAKNSFEDRWRPRLFFGVIQTTCVRMTISRYRLIERLLKGRYFVGLLRRLNLCVLPLPGRR
jgi:hypothetical protein